MTSGILSEPVAADLPQPREEKVPPKANPRKVAAKKDLPLLCAGDHLQVTNDEGKKTVVFRWAGESWILEPGETKFVIFEALVDALGDPRSMDSQPTKFSDGKGNRGIIPDRYWNLCQLFARYAVKEEKIDDLVARAPCVSVATYDGQRVTFPAQRPDMLPYPVEVIDDRAVNADTTRMIDAVAAENEDLKEHIVQQEERLDKMQDRIDQLIGLMEKAAPTGSA